MVRHTEPACAPACDGDTEIYKTCHFTSRNGFILQEQRIVSGDREATAELQAGLQNHGQRLFYRAKGLLGRLL